MAAVLCMNPNREAFDTRFDWLCCQLYAEGIWSPSTVKGCTSVELAVIEATYNLQLPHSYAKMMAEIGWNAGKFTTLGEYEFDFNVAVTRLAKERQYAAAEERLEELDRILSPNGFVFLHRLGDYHLFFHCDGNDDPEIRYYFSSDLSHGFAYASVIDMLNGLADYCRSIKYW